MKNYLNKAGGSAVKRYESKDEAIKIEFNDGSVYWYNYQVNGRENIEKMKALAELGVGLTTFIDKHIGSRFAEKIK